MISNLDIERRKTKIDSDDKHNKWVANRTKQLSEYDSKILKSKKFTRYMQRLLKFYSKGAYGMYLPLFYPKNFPFLILSKFNSYNLESSLVFDWERNFFFFKKRFSYNMARD